MTLKLPSENNLVLIDDDEVEAMLLQRYVARSELTNPVLTFQSGESFLEHLDQVEAGAEPLPALVLVDARMPRMTGFEVIETVRRRSAFSSVPAMVLFSNSDDPRDQSQAAKSGADAYVVKPSDGDAYITFLNSLK